MNLLFYYHKKYYIWFLLVVCFSFFVQLVLTNELQDLKLPKTETDRVFVASYSYSFSDMTLQDFEACVEGIPEEIPDYSTVIVETGDLVISDHEDRSSEVTICAAYPDLPENMISVREETPKDNEFVALFRTPELFYDRDIVTVDIALKGKPYSLRVSGTNSFIIPWVCDEASLVKYETLADMDLSIRKIVMVFHEPLSNKAEKTLKSYMQNYADMVEYQPPLNGTEDYDIISKQAYFAIGVISFISIVSNLGVLLFCFALSKHELAVYRICGASYIRTRGILILNMIIVGLLGQVVSLGVFVILKQVFREWSKSKLSISFLLGNLFVYLAGYLICLLFLFVKDFILHGKQIRVEEAL